MKLRSCRPYAQLYALADFVFEEYKETLETELGLKKSQLWEFFIGLHAEAIRSVHVEQDHAVNNIR